LEPEDTSDTALVEVSVLVARNPAAKSVLIQQQEVGGKVSRDPLPHRLSMGRREREGGREREIESVCEREGKKATQCQPHHTHRVLPHKVSALTLKPWTINPKP
jgi:hypothetical protein